MFSYLLWVCLFAVLAEDILGSCAKVVIPLRPLTTQIQELQQMGMRICEVLMCVQDVVILRDTYSHDHAFILLQLSKKMVVLM